MYKFKIYYRKKGKPNSPIMCDEVVSRSSKRARAFVEDELKAEGYIIVKIEKVCNFKTR